MKNCKGIFGKLFGHKYVAMGHRTFRGIHTVTRRVSDGEMTGIGIASFYYLPMKEKVYDFTYVHSQCSRCGHIIKE